MRFAMKVVSAILYFAAFVMMSLATINFMVANNPMGVACAGGAVVFLILSGLYAYLAYDIAIEQNMNFTRSIRFFKRSFVVVIVLVVFTAPFAAVEYFNAVDPDGYGLTWCERNYHIGTECSDYGYVYRPPSVYLKDAQAYVSRIKYEQVWEERVVGPWYEKIEVYLGATSRMIGSYKRVSLNYMKLGWKKLDLIEIDIT